MKHLLIADDEPLALKLLSELLTASGYQVSTATNGTEALALLERHAFDAVITDYHMPDIDGLELVRRIGGDIPVFMTTVDAESLGPEDRRRVHLLPKPLSIHNLLDRIGQVVG